MRQEFKYQFSASIHLPKLENLVNQVNSFSGRTARTDRAVMRALIQLADLQGAYTIRPGVRKISEYCGHDPRTVCRALRRLERKGWAKYIWEANPRTGESSRIRINWELAANSEVATPEPDSHILRDISIWTGDGLGSNARTIYKALLLADCQLKKKQLQELTQLGYKAVTSSLDLLLGGNLVVRDGRKYEIRRMTPADESDLLKKVRESFNLEKKQDYRLNRHFNQRSSFKWLSKNSFNFRIEREFAFKEERKRKELRLKLSQNDAVTKLPRATVDTKKQLQ